MASTSSSITTAPTNPWMRILEALEKKVNRHSYDTWLKPTRYSHTNGGIVFVRVPTNEFLPRRRQYADLIQEAMDDLQLGLTDVKFVAPDGRSRRDASAPRRRTFAHRAYAYLASSIRLGWRSATESALYVRCLRLSATATSSPALAAQAVAENPSKAYNPLFLYGGVGMGKTHLMRGHRPRGEAPSAQAAICYLSSEKFTNEMINSLAYDKMSSFRDKFRNVDVLIIDDIQFLAQKERTQEEFFHTFNALDEGIKQSLSPATARRKELADVEDRLRSRFEWGLIADIQPPDLETRLPSAKESRAGSVSLLPTDVALFIASNIRSNVRELEGALIRLMAHSSLIGSEITLPYTQQVLKNLSIPKRQDQHRVDSKTRIRAMRPAPH